MDNKNHQNDVFLRKLLNLLPGNVYWKDTKGIYQGCNINFARIVGFDSPKDIIGKHDRDLLGLSMAKLIEESDQYVFRKNQPITKEEVGFDIDSNPAVYLSTKIPLHDEEENTIGLVGLSQNITELKKMQEDLQKAHQLNLDFIQNMQHDLRTPTSGMMAILEELAATETDVTRREKLTLTYHASKRVFDIVSEIIDFDRITQQKEPYLFKKFNLAQLIQEVIELNQPAALSKGLSLDIFLDEHLPQVVKGDPKRLSRMLINLVGNAIKFTQTGGVSVHAKVIKVENDDMLIQLEVHDTGIGIPEEKRDLIYTQFTRFTPSNAGYYKGSGLGLNIVKRYVDDMQGEIDVYSEVGKGTIFYVILPFKKPLTEDIVFGENEHTFSDESVSQMPMAKELNILLIEDDVLARHIGQSIIKTVSGSLSIAENMAQAMELLQQIKFDLVISDLGLPDGDGKTIVKSIKSNPNTLNYQTPFVALTAHQDKNNKNEAKNAGFLAVMTKPLTKKHFISVLNHYIIPPNNMPSELEIIDLALGRKLIGDEKIAIEMIELLQTELPKEMALIKAYYANNDIDAIRKIFHKMKGGLCYCGVPRLNKILNLVHTEVKTVQHVSEMKDSFESLYDEMHALVDEFNRIESQINT